MIRPLRLLFSWIVEVYQRLHRRERVHNVLLLGTRPLRTKIRASAGTTEAGSSLQSGRIVVKPQSTEIEPSNPHTMVVVSNRHTDTKEVRREASTYWEDKGWVKSGETFSGHYGTNGKRWSGAIAWNRHGFKCCLILDPPRELWKHPHARCFYYVGNRWYAVHFSTRPRTPDAAIIAVERILDEATGGR